MDANQMSDHLDTLGNFATSLEWRIPAEEPILLSTEVMPGLLAALSAVLAAHGRSVQRSTIGHQYAATLPALP